MKYKNLSQSALKSLPNHELRMDRNNYNAYLRLPEIQTPDMPIEAVKAELQKINDQLCRNKLNNHSNGVDFKYERERK